MNNILNDEFIGKYSKKILAFAYGKTHDIYDAEDLSQEILLALFDSFTKYGERQIENIDGFVYTICCHCWSNFYRKNKRHWNHANIDTTPNLFDNCDVQGEVENAMLIEKMRIEIAYLSKLHRDIIVMSYYDGKSSGEISKALNISSSTIRWHLVEIRKNLKERIEMNNMQNLSYKPVSLQTGWAGRSCFNMRGVGQNRLVDNICYICYGTPRTIEEIARSLSVAAVYLEYHIAELINSDYLKVVDGIYGNKYQTNFFIRTKAFTDIAPKYCYENIKDKAEKVYESIEKRYDDIKAINFIGSDFDKDFLLWALIPILVQKLERKSNDIISQKKDYAFCMPKRKDGSEHWLRAFLREDEIKSTLSKEIAEFGKKTDYYFSDFKQTLYPDRKIWGFQLESYATTQAGRFSRYLTSNELNEFVRILDIIKDNLEPNEYDKTLIAKYAEAGYLKVDGGKTKLMIPYFDKYKQDELDKIFDEIINSLGDDFFVDFMEGYIKIAKAKIPDFVSEDEKLYAVLSGLSCMCAALYYLADHGKLRYPTDEEARRLSTVLFGE